MYVGFAVAAAGDGVHLPTEQLGASPGGSRPAAPPPPPAWDMGRSPQSHRHPVCFPSHGELSASLLLPAGGTQDDPSGSIPLLFPHGNPHSWRWLPSPPLTSEITAQGGGVGGEPGPTAVWGCSPACSRKALLSGLVHPIGSGSLCLQVMAGFDAQKHPSLFFLLIFLLLEPSCVWVIY